MPRWYSMISEQRCRNNLWSAVINLIHLSKGNSPQKSVFQPIFREFYCGISKSTFPNFWPSAVPSNKCRNTNDKVYHTQWTLATLANLPGLRLCIAQAQAAAQTYCEVINFLRNPAILGSFHSTWNGKHQSLHKPHAPYSWLRAHFGCLVSIFILWCYNVKGNFHKERTDLPKSTIQISYYIP